MNIEFVLLGLVAGALVGMTGVGAGSLVTPALALSGVPPALAVGTALASAAAYKPYGALVHRAEGTLDLRLAGLLAAGSLPSALVTLALLSRVSTPARSALIGWALTFALALTAVALLAGRAKVAVCAARLGSRSAPLRALLTVGAGAMIGALVTASSIGAGTLGAAAIVALHPSMPAARVAGADIAHAVPLTLLACAGHLWLGHVDFALAANLLTGAVPGIIAGSLLAGRLPEPLVRRLLAASLLFASARLAAAGL